MNVSTLPLSQEQLEEVLGRLNITDVDNATIRQIVAVSNMVEGLSGEPVIHLELGNPGLPACEVGVRAEIEALRKGIANTYPNISGMPELKAAAEAFLHSFMNVNIPARCIVPTVGSMQGCFATLMLMGQREPGKRGILFMDPGFPAQHNQAFVLGLEQVSMDIYAYRGAAMEAELERILSKGNISAMIYSTPNNPAWTNMTEQELEIIGRMATKYDVTVIEDHAYMGMDFRKRYGMPGVAPFIPTVARYTDNYILLLSASKIFSYAGQRVAVVAMSPAVADRKYDFFRDFYGVPSFLDAFTFGALYALSSGVTHSAQYALAAMFRAAVEGSLDFVNDCSEYGRRAAIAKDIFLRNGFNILYSHDGREPIGDGFFFTLAYGGMTGAELQKELMRHGISAISLKSTGSRQQGVRVCVPLLTDQVQFDRLEKRLDQFRANNPLKS
ncbi:MAG: pyridoxal phosphate-dependent aminotransferase [Muribaculaceae bacterium]|nr:pyridoxal phosphate-dependent aminotransferase [Muribaculaceae bacterium]